MKIIHVVSSLNVGGAERFVIDLAAEQKTKSNFSVIILSMGKHGEPLEDEVHRFGLGLINASQLGELRKSLAQVDIVHVHSSYCLLRILLASLFLPIKVVYTRHNERVHQTLKWKCIYLLAKFKLHQMIFVAEKARENYLKVYPSFSTKSVTILNGVLPMAIDKITSDKFRISHVGRFVSLKAQHVLIRAVARLPIAIQEKVSISFFGTGDLMLDNQKLADELLPHVEVNFRGFVTDRDLIYSNTDLLVVTSETEGLSLAILEALASGTPTIASDVGGNPELVEHDVNGYLYPYSNYNQLANLIESLMNDNEKYRQFSHRCIAKFQQGFSMSICAENYLHTYS